MTTAPAKGETVPLNHTRKGRERIIAGLSWDPKADEAGFLDRLRGRDQQHDLDISCFLFSEDGRFADFVGAEAQDSMDESGAVYHSGDDMTGSGGGDDEFISAELSRLPDHIHHLAFVVEIRSDHNFSDVDAPTARIADGATNTNLLETPIAADGEGRTASAFVFAVVSRAPESETGWVLRHIHTYPDLSRIKDWGDYLKPYLA